MARVDSITRQARKRVKEKVFVEKIGPRKDLRKYKVLVEKFGKKERTGFVLLGFTTMDNSKIAKKMKMAPKSKIAVIGFFEPHLEGKSVEGGGIGTAVFKKMVAIAKKEKGVKAITITTPNQTLINISEKNGFRIVGENNDGILLAKRVVR